MFIAALVGLIAAAVALLVWRLGHPSYLNRVGGLAGAESAPEAPRVPAPKASVESAGTKPKSPAVVSLRQVIEEMIEIGQEQTAFLDRVKGELVTLDDEIRVAIEAGDDVAPTERFDAEKLAALKEMFKHGQLLELPTRFERREFTIREQYAREITNGRHRDLLLQALQEKGAFRAFEQTLRRLGLRQDWERYRDRAFEQIAIGWLEAHKIAYERRG